MPVRPTTCAGEGEAVCWGAPKIVNIMGAHQEGYAGERAGARSEKPYASERASQLRGRSLNPQHQSRALGPEEACTNRPHPKRRGFFLRKDAEPLKEKT